MRIAIVAGAATPTNSGLAGGEQGASWEVLTPAQALSTLVPGDVAIGRLDVLPTLDGVDEGLWSLGALDTRGVPVLGSSPA